MCAVKNRGKSNRSSTLVFETHRFDAATGRGGSEENLYEFGDGVPMLWIFAFGARNVWNPGDHVEDRGGAVGHRNLYETQVDVALSRLEQAEANLRSAQPMWAWFSGMPLLRRKLMLKPRHGFIRVATPWITPQDEDLFNRWRSAISFAENCVNYCGVGDFLAAVRSLRELEPFCPFLPDERLADLGQLRKVKLAAGEADTAHRLALLTLGTPVVEETFLHGIERDVTPALEAHAKLPQHVFSFPEPVTATADAGAGADAAGGSLVGKLTGLFRRG